MMNNSIIITGGAGFIGSHVVKLFVNKYPEGADMDLITYVTDRAGHGSRYAIDSTKLQKEHGREPSLQFEKGNEKTVKWYLDNQEWLDNVTYVTSGNISGLL